MNDLRTDWAMEPTLQKPSEMGETGFACFLACAVRYTCGSCAGGYKPASQIN